MLSSDEIVINMKTQIGLLLQRYADLEEKMNMKVEEKAKHQSVVGAEELYILREENALLQESNTKQQGTIQDYKIELTQKMQCIKLRSPSFFLSLILFFLRLKRGDDLLSLTLCSM
jgi:hypothetical protein